MVERMFEYSTEERIIGVIRLPNNIIIIIIIKKGQQCKAGRELYTPYQPHNTNL